MTEWSVEAFTDSGHSSKELFLQSSLHTKSPPAENFETLGRRIISGQVRWGPKLLLNSESGYIPYYWEWLKDVVYCHSKTLKDARLYDAVLASLYTYDCNTDVLRAFCEAWCPATNTLHTSAGELSISLWDLHMLGGLSILGDFYDEVVPSFSDLTGSVPRCCEYLFSAFHRIHDEHTRVSVDQWVRFWFRGQLKHVCPLIRKSKKVSCPKKTHNPDEDISAEWKWTDADEGAFTELMVDSTFRGDTYLAAFLACWLCTFALPNDEVGFIRPETFKVASMMATGHVFSLAIPVLASIYKGLNKISVSSEPGNSTVCFPVHYVYAWLAHYFGTHHAAHDYLLGPKMVRFSGEGWARYFDEREARTLIHLADNVEWDSLTYVKNRNQLFVDDGNLSCSPLSYFISVRSSYLVLRCDRLFTIEPYSPHRFARQFGFCQSAPGVLKVNHRTASLGNALKFWRLCLLKETMSKILFSARPFSFRRHTSQGYRVWWSREHGSYLSDGIETLINSTCPSLKSKKIRKQKEKASLDVPRSSPLPIKAENMMKTGRKRPREKFAVAREPTLLDVDDDRHSDECWKHSKPKHRVEPHGDNHSGELQVASNCVGEEQQDGLRTSKVSTSSEHSVMRPKCVGSIVGDANGIGAVDSPIAIPDDDVTSPKKVHSLEIHIKKPTLVPEKSIFGVNKEIVKVRHQTSLMYGKILLSKLEDLSFEKVPTFKKAADEFCDEIDKLGVIDSSPLRNFVAEYIRDVQNFSETKTSLETCMTLNDQDKRRAGIKLQLAAASSAKDAAEEHIQTLCADHQRICSKKAELEEELARLTEQNQHLEASISQSKIEKAESEKVVATLEKELSELEEARLVDDGEFAAFVKLEALLEKERSNLKNFKWAD